MDCLFCQIAQKKIPSEIFYEDNDILVFDDIHPQAPTHKLIIPRQHMASLEEASTEHIPLLGKLLLTAQRIAKELGFAGEGYRVVVNTNKDAGQYVFHIHLHLLAGRSLQWPPG